VIGIDAHIARLGFTVCEIHGRVSSTASPTKKRKT